MARNNDFKIRVVLYSVFVIIVFLLVKYEQIGNSYNINKAENCYKKQDYICAFKFYRSAFATRFDNQKYVDHYFETLKKMKKIAVVQEELSNLLEDYPENSHSQEIKSIFEELKNEVENKYGRTYIENAVQGTSIMHWNIAEEPITIFIDSSTSSQYPGYYYEEIKKAFSDYAGVLNHKIKFDYINNSEEAKINIVFMDKISGGECENLTNCANVMGLTENSVIGNLLAKSVIKFRFKDTDNTNFTRNQIYNIAKHEIGHALGISGHSYNNTDIMYPVSNDASWSRESQTIKIERKEFSYQDINTIKLLYDIVPDITDKKYDTIKYPGMYMPVAVIGTKNEIAEKNLEESKRYLGTVDASYISQMTLAEGYYTNKDLDNAYNAFHRALAYAKTDDEIFSVYNNLAVILYNKKDYYQAVEYANMANRYSPQEEANEIKAYSYIEMGKYKAAQELLERLIKQKPSNTIFSSSLVLVYFKQYKIFSAFGELKRIKKQNPSAVEDPLFRQYKFLFNFVG